MKTLAFTCLLLGIANIGMVLLALVISHDSRYTTLLAHSSGSALLALMMYATINDKEPDGKA